MRHPYYWNEDRLNCVRDVLSTATSMSDACIELRKYGITTNRESLQMVSYLHDIARPMMEHGGKRR